jgi:transposase InsO family protein
MNRPYTSQDKAAWRASFTRSRPSSCNNVRIGSDGELIAVLAGYIDRFYNVRRLRSSLGYRSRVELEQLVSS